MSPSQGGDTSSNLVGATKVPCAESGRRQRSAKPFVPRFESGRNLQICVGDAKEDISVSGTESCGFESHPTYQYARMDGIGIHAGFKNQCSQELAGSSPAPCTICAYGGTGETRQIKDLVSERMCRFKSC